MQTRTPQEVRRPPASTFYGHGGGRCRRGGEWVSIQPEGAGARVVHLRLRWVVRAEIYERDRPPGPHGQLGTVTVCEIVYCPPGLEPERLRVSGPEALALVRDLCPEEAGGGGESE